MAETRGITVKIPVELHSQVKAEQESLGITMNQYIENVLAEHFTMDRKEDKNMGPTRTLAFQVSEDLFQRVKDYLKKTGITQKEFVIGLIEDELERFEMSEKEQTADSGAADEDEDEELDEDGQNAAESPREGGWEAAEGSDEAEEETAQNGPCENGNSEPDEEPEDDEDLGDDEDEDFDEDEDEDEDENMGMGPVM